MRWEKEGLAVEALFSRAGIATQILVRTEVASVLFDAGDGTLRDLIQRGFPPQKLNGVFLTHGHADHMAGLYGILGYLRAEDHKGTFVVWYPEGCEEIRNLIDAFRRSYGETIPYELIERPLRDGEQVNLGDIKVIARRVKHWHSIKDKVLIPAPAMGYRLEFKGTTIAVTGDTAFCPSLIDLIRDVDLALIEASLPEEASEEQKKFLHLTRTKAKELGTLAKNFYLIHSP